MKTIQAGLVFVISDRCQGAVYTPQEYSCNTRWVVNLGLSPASYPGSETVGGVEFAVMKMICIRVA